MNSTRNRVAAAIIAATTAVSALLFGGAEPASRSYARDQVYEIAATQDFKYRVGDRPAQDLDGALGYVRTWQGRPAHHGEGYVIRQSGTMGWSRVRTLGETIGVLRRRLRGAEDLDQWTVVSRKDRFQVWVMKVDVNPAAIVNSTGTQAIDVVIGTVTKKFGAVPEWGICACKHIEGSSSWSQHAYCNAVDFGGDVERLDGIARYLLGLTRAGWVPASQILWRGHNLLTGSHVGDHYNHIHVSGDPLRGGSPTAC